MLTLRRFRAMAGSYGADLQRWPEAERGAAQALLNASPRARELVNEELMLDEALEAASAREDAAHWPPGEQNAALARLRSGVVARIGSSIGRRPAIGRFGSLLGGGGQWAFSPYLRWAGIATCSGFAITAGLLIGATYVSSPASDTVLMMLQPVPIQLLAY
jgi:hypothetical protein